MEALPSQSVETCDDLDLAGYLKSNYFYVAIDTSRPGSSLFIIRCDFELDKNIKKIKETYGVDAPEGVEDAEFDCFTVPYAESMYAVAGTHVALLDTWKELATALEMHLQPGLPHIATSTDRFPLNHPSSLVYTLQNDNCNGDPAEMADLLGREQDLITSYMDGLEDYVYDAEIDAACGIDIKLDDTFGNTSGPKLRRRGEEEGGEEGEERGERGEEDEGEGGEEGGERGEGGEEEEGEGEGRDRGAAGGGGARDSHNKYDNLDNIFEETTGKKYGLALSESACKEKGEAEEE